MSCEEWRKKLKRWLEEHWQPGEGRVELPQAFRVHAGTCPGCAARLEATLLLMDGEGLRKAAPKGLASSITEGLKRGRKPRPISSLPWIAVPAAAALAAVLTFVITFQFTGRRPGPGGEPDTVLVRLVLEAPGAAEVSVVGDWNDWDPLRHPLSDPDGDGIWEIEIPLKGDQELRYQFLIDRKEWIPDPQAALNIEDGFGGVNSILQI